MTHLLPNPRRRRGSALAMALVMTMIITGLVMVLAWTAGLQSQITSSETKLDQAFYAAETGAHTALWKFKQNNSYNAPASSPLTGTLAIGSRSYAWSATCIGTSMTTAVALWHMDEGSGTTSADATGNGNTASLYKKGVSWTTGKYNKALLFDGNQGYADCGNKSILNISSDVSIAAWVKLNGNESDQKIGAIQDGNAGGYKMTIYNMIPEFEVRDAYNNATLNRYVSGGTTLSTGTWYHIIGVFSGSGGYIRTYVNGNPDRTLNAVVPANLAPTTGDFYIATEPFSTGSLLLDGSLDDLQVFNYALSDSQAMALYKNTPASTKITSTATLLGGSVTDTVSFNVSPGTPLKLTNYAGPNP